MPRRQDAGATNHHEAMPGLSRFASSPKRLGAVSTNAPFWAAFLSTACGRAVWRDPRPMHARLPGETSCASLHAAPRHLTGSKPLVAKRGGKTAAIQKLCGEVGPR